MEVSNHIGQGTDEKINIPMVDDQPGKLLSYEAMLGELGENLIKAQSGVEALEQLLKTEIALVLMDVSMPGMDGFETAQLIHAHPRFQNTPIVFASGIHVTDLQGGMQQVRDGTNLLARLLDQRSVFRDAFGCVRA
jgi:CheY-like chemotaxis protein